MTADLSTAEAVVAAALGHVFPAAQVEVRHGGQILWSAAYGWLDPERRSHPTGRQTLFDLASVTKLFVVTAFMTLVEEGAVILDQPVATVLPEFSGVRAIRPHEDPLRPGAMVSVAWEGAQSISVDAGRVTFRHLLAHNSGLPAWRPLFQADNADVALSAVLGTTFAYPTGARTIYSDLGLIHIGLAVERLAGRPLDEVVRRRVVESLGLVQTRYLRLNRQADPPADQLGAIDPHSAAQPSSTALEVAPTEFCAWRNRRIVGEVHDENAARLGGVAGHAGLFSTAHELAAFGQSFSDRSPGLDSGALLRPATIAEMTRLQAQDGSTRRGLGFALWSPDPDASGNPFSGRAFGHTGFTGGSLWIDPGRELVVACCTNRVYYGRDAKGILEFRVALHRAIVEAIDA